MMSKLIPNVIDRFSRIRTPTYNISKSFQISYLSECYRTLPRRHYPGIQNSEFFRINTVYFSSTSSSSDITNRRNNINVVRNEVDTSENRRRPAKKKKKQLKKNQLGQKGQNRTQIKKDKERNRKLFLKEQEKKLKILNKRKARSLRFATLPTLDSENDDDDNDVVDHNSTSFQQTLELSVGQESTVTDMNIKSSSVESDVSIEIPTIIRPPTMLKSTSSRNVFISKIACEKSSIDPSTLFVNNSKNVNHSTRGCYVHFPQATFDLPLCDQPEVAILGRSNVGKSSLINAIIRRKGLAVTSKHPGRTQQAYYYGLLPFGKDYTDTTGSVSLSKELQNNTDGFIIDLPGYGYAVGPDESVDDWQKRTQEFLLMRRDYGSLKRLYLLQDARVGALILDLNVQNWMDEAEIPYTVVLTKIDAVSPSAIIKHVNLACMAYHRKYMDLELLLARNVPKVSDQHHSEIKEGNDDINAFKYYIDEVHMSPFVHTTSAKANIGIDELRTSIEEEFRST